MCEAEHDVYYSLVSASIMLDESRVNVRAIAFYLPQYHPIAENDRFWGKGFTEWTNVAKAKPLFRGHKQPHLPSDLGFYDLRVPEVRKQQADLARGAGVEGFCYWHYWFGNGKRALERVFNEVMQSGEPDFPFCLAWANESWTGRWHGLDSQIIFKQEYPGPSDCTEHFYTLLPAFKDRRYLRVDDRPLFLIYGPKRLPGGYLRCWQELAQKEGLPPFYYVGMGLTESERSLFGYDAVTKSSLDEHMERALELKPFARYLQKGKRVARRAGWGILCRTGMNGDIVDYRDYARVYIEHRKENPLDGSEFPVVIPCWDNTPRCGRNGDVLINSHPSLFCDVVQDACHHLRERPSDCRILFIKSWNEWAEGNYLEPDQEYGHGWLEALRKGLCSPESGNKSDVLPGSATEEQKRGATRLETQGEGRKIPQRMLFLYGGRNSGMSQGRASGVAGGERGRSDYGV